MVKIFEKKCVEKVSFFRNNKINFVGRKAQGALEFLMTYGWAFLVILIMIGALAYFGVLSPTKFLPERCSLGSQFICKDYLTIFDKTLSQGKMTLKLQNNLGRAIYVVGTTSTGAVPLGITSEVSSPEGFGVCNIQVLQDAKDGGGAVVTYNIASDGVVGSGKPVSDGGIFTLEAAGCTGLGGLVSGTKYKISVNLVYFDATSDYSYAHTVQGELYANVEEGSATATVAS